MTPFGTNDTIWRHPTLTQLPGEFPIMPKNGADGGGWWAQAEAWRLWCGSRQNSRYWGSPALSGACFMQIPASESLLFLFPTQKGQVPAEFGEAAKPACL